MDFEAWWSKQNGITLQMAAPGVIARAVYNQGRIDRKEACLKICNGERTEVKYPAVPWIIEEIKKL